MSKVKFDAQTEDDYRHNFSLLLDAFSKNNIPVVCTVFLHWSVFKYVSIMFI